MAVKIRVQVNKTWIEVDVQNPKDAFKQIHQYAELFSFSECGLCHSPNVSPSVRDHDGNEYYSIRCGDCSAELSMGQHKTGNTLFVKRRDADGKPLPNGGWARYERRMS
jgi:hypothetical protein